MRRTVSLLALAFALAASPAAFADDPPPAAPERPSIDVAFVLDTTGSMSGLIEGAKKKIWSIVNALLFSEPVPEVRVGLVGYRDRGDEYVVLTHDLSDNIDEVFAHLSAFQADGGGDTPESVEAALAAAIDDLSWREGEALRIVFLVGDAPPHVYDDDGLDVPALCEKAVLKGLVVNAIRCGNAADTETVWKEIARLAEGNYLSIDASGGMTVVATPFDEAIGGANDRLVETRLIYGSASYQRAAESRLENQKLLSADAKAGCGTWNAFNDRLDRQDLLDECARGSIDEVLARIPEADLPEVLRDRTAPERRAFVESKLAERRAIQAELEALAAKREAHVKAELAKLEGQKDSFDQGVVDTLRRQAGEFGVTVK